MNLAGIPEPSDIRALLEGYGMDTQTDLTLSGTWVSPSPIITHIDTRRLTVGMNVFGTGIPALASIQSVDIVDVDGQITINVPTTLSGTASAIRVSYYCVVSDAWIQNTITDEIMPIIERMTRQKFDGLAQVTEYYDGTGSSIMILRRRPIVQLLQISYTNVDTNLYYLTPTAIQVIAEEGILKAKANFNESSYIPVFYRGDRNLRITYQYGYAECPGDVARAITLLAADLTLAHVANKTGGGNQGLPGISRDYGDKGKYTNIRRDFALRANSLLRKYMTGGAS
jgi:hypothetical protein